MKTVAIIQARLDSTRLHGKALLAIGNQTMLDHVIQRTRIVEGVDEIVVATTWRETDRPIENHCANIGVECFQGPAADVLSRYYHCAHIHQADRILRVTADCPLLDPELNTRILNALQGDVDYAASTGYPEGHGQEAFTLQALERANAWATDPYDREHVVTHMLAHRDTYNCVFVHSPHVQAGQKWSVDTWADLQRVRAILEPVPA